MIIGSLGYFCVKSCDMYKDIKKLEQKLEEMNKQIIPLEKEMKNYKIPFKESFFVERIKENHNNNF
jgi:cell division protein FtsB